MKIIKISNNKKHVSYIREYDIIFEENNKHYECIVNIEQTVYGEKVQISFLNNVKNEKEMEDKLLEFIKERRL